MTKIIGPLLKRLHLDRVHFLLTGRAVQLVKEFFDLLDIRGASALDDVQFLAFMQYSTDLPENKIMKVFDTLDIDSSGLIEFDEFYLLICMLVAVKDDMAKQFLWRHSRTCFELLDQDGSRSISINEFDTFGTIFNISSRASAKIFAEFDVDGSEELDYEEFRIFSLACLDKQRELEKKKIKRAQKQKKKPIKGCTVS